jgi:hypothetical protein
MKLLSEIETLAGHSARASLTLSTGAGLVTYNRIYRLVCAYLPWPELRQSNTSLATTSTAGVVDSTYTWPGTALFLTLEAMQMQDGNNLDNYKMMFNPPDHLTWALAENEERMAVPSYWRGKAADGGIDQIEFRPKPLYAGKTIRMTGIMEPEEAVNGNSATVFKTAAADDVLSYIIAADFLDVDGFPEFADRQISKARQLLVKMFGEEAATVPEQIIRGG